MSNFIYVMSRREVTERIMEQDPSSVLDRVKVISILDTGMVSPFITSVYSGFPGVQTFRGSLLTIHCDDVEDETDPWYQAFDLTHADRIIKWINQVFPGRKLTSELWVHCWAGKSRSAAVAKFLSGYMLVPYACRDPRRELTPNPRILKTLEEAARWA